MDRPAGVRAARRPVLWGQVTYAVALLVCVAISPHLVLKRSEVGLSNFGVHWSTVVPYSVALIGSSVGLVRGSRRARWPQSAVLAACGAGAGALLITTYPYHLNGTLTDVHDTVGVATFALTALASAVAVVLDRRLAPVAVVHLAGIVVAVGTLVGAWHLLLIAQVVTSAAFSLEALTLASPRPR